MIQIRVANREGGLLEAGRIPFQRDSLSLPPGSRISHPLHAAFTLIEVLAVVAIMALLLAMLVPALGSARTLSKRVVCQANLAQLARAWHEYLANHNDHFLQGVNCEQIYGGKQGMGAREVGSDPNLPVAKPLNRCVGLPLVVRDGAKAGVFNCPTDRGSIRVLPSFFEYCGTSYRMNHMLVGQDSFRVEIDDPARTVMKQVKDRLKNLTRSRIGNESKLVLMGDQGWFAQWYYLTPKEDLFEWHGHRGRHNMAFLDGHVEYVRIRKGLSTTSNYTVIPFTDLQEAVVTCQREVP